MSPMNDPTLVVLTVLLAALALLCVRGCAALLPEDRDER